MIHQTSVINCHADIILSPKRQVKITPRTILLNYSFKLMKSIGFVNQQEHYNSGT